MTLKEANKRAATTAAFLIVFGILLTPALILFKLVGAIDFSWFYVLGAMWIPYIFVLVWLFIVFIAAQFPGSRT